LKKNKITDNTSTDLIETQFKNTNKFWYFVGVITIIGGVCFILWYLDAYSSIKPGTGQTPPLTGNNESNTSNVLNNLTESNLQNLSTSRSEQIQVLNNQTNNPVQSVSNNDWYFSYPDKTNTSTSNTTSNSMATILDRLERSPSPTNSTCSNDSSETIRQTIYRTYT